MPNGWQLYKALWCISIFVATEYLEGGELKKALELNEKKEINVGIKSRIKIMNHIAKGMEFLTRNCHSAIQSQTNDNGYVHRDLAARNVLVSHHDLRDKDLVAKVNDFGMAKPIKTGDIQVSDSSTRSFE